MIYDKIILILILLFAALAVQVNRLRTAVIYLGAFSLIVSFCYLLYSAPDVAISEAIIGSTLTAILYLVTLRTYKVFNIYYTGVKRIEKKDSGKIYRHLSRIIEEFSHDKELELHIVHSSENNEHVETEYEYDMIVSLSADTITIYGKKENYNLELFTKEISNQMGRKVKINVYKK
jgi:putative multicomponent Na+:H+ antiporter subunit B